MREDMLAKRLFYGGCLGLPWLWIVHLLYWWGKERQQGQEGEASSTNEGALLQHADTDEDDADEATPAALSAEEIKMEAKKWVRRSLYGSIIVCSIFLTWIIVFQVFKDDFGPEWFVMSEDEAEKTGW